MSINIKNLIFSYSKNPGETVLDIPEWKVETGERVFVQGASGSGKSTLLNVLCGTVAVSEGTVEVFDQRIDRMNARKRDRFRADYIGYVFQQFNLIAYLNVVDNVRLACQFGSAEKAKASPARIEQLLTRLNIDSQLWNKPANTLSIGQQQRVAIARALINQPKLLIVDEPTSSLDEQNRNDFMLLLMEQLEGTETTLIFVSHDLSLASYFSRLDSMTSLNCNQVS